MNTKTNEFKPGDKVRLTGKFLRNTGQYTGPEGQSRWVVQDCTCGNGLCSNPSYVLTNEPVDTSIYMADELEAEPCLKYRRIAAVNLERCK